MKLGIVIDSSAGITKKEALDRGWHYLPLYLNIDGKEYADGVDITPDEYYKMIDISMNTQTSATPPGIILDTINSIKKQYEFIIVYGLSNKLSSQTNNIKTFLKNHKNVHVVNSMGVGYAIVKDLELIEKLAKKGATKQELVTQIEFLTKQQIGVVVPKTMDWLVRGGRISPSLAKMANLFQIIPIILLKNGELHKFGKSRVFKHAITKASIMLQKKIKNKNGHFIFYTTNANNQEQIISKIQNELGIEEIDVRQFPPIIVNHIGPNSIALIFASKEII